MDLCNINEIKALLARHGFHFSKAKGQNFLTQSWVPQNIVLESGVDETCGVLEVGPGIGPLTQQLCRYAKKVVAVEVDRTLQPVLAETMVVGRSTATSSAWVGPESATRRTPLGPPSLPSSSARISVMVIRVSGSTPLATSTMI